MGGDGNGTSETVAGYAVIGKRAFPEIKCSERQLLNDYGIFYDNKRGHERKIILKRLEPKNVKVRRYASVATVLLR